MVRDLAREGVSEYKQQLESHYLAFKDGLIKYPEPEIINKGIEFYSKLNDDEKLWLAELKKALDNQKKKTSIPLRSGLFRRVDYRDR